MPFLKSESIKEVFDVEKVLAKKSFWEKHKPLICDPRVFRVKKLLSELHIQIC